MPPKSERKQAFIITARDEVGRYKSGEINRLTPIGYLGEQFGYANRTALEYLQRSGVSRERIDARHEVREQGITPSTQAAWIIAVLASGGTVNSQNATLSLAGYDEELLKAFQESGEHLFRMDAAVTNVDPNNPEYKRVIFYTRDLPHTLGDLRRDRWPDTIAERHPWILKNDEYIWSFLEGVFETSGTASTTAEKRRITFNTNYLQNANLIADLLERVAIEGASLKRDRNTREGIKGIELYRRVDIKRFAEHIHSVNASREEQLTFFRELPDLNRYFGSSTVEIVNEWVRLKELLGHSPRSNEIQELKKRGETRFSHSVYIDRFTDRGTFVEARDNLERLVDERTTPAIDFSALPDKGEQVFPIEKSQTTSGLH